MRPMSYNGWVYGYANPSRFADPSGNIPCEILPPDEREECTSGGGGANGYGSVPPSYPADLPPCTSALLAAGELCNPDPCDPDPIYDPPLTNGQDKALQVYYQFKNHPGWWNDHGKKELSTLTVLAIMANFEGADLLKWDQKGSKYFAEAFGRTYWAWCPNGCQIKKGIPPRNLLSFLRGSQAWLARTPYNTPETYYNFTKAKEISRQVLYPYGASYNWRTGWNGDMNRPIVWANVQGSNPLWFKNWIWFASDGLNRGNSHIGFGEHQITYVFGGQGEIAARNQLRTFYIMSYNQIREHCTSRGAYSCVTMVSAVERPNWVPKIYSEYGNKTK